MTKPIPWADGRLSSLLLLQPSVVQPYCQLRALIRERPPGIGLIGMKTVRYLAPMWSLGSGDESAFDEVYNKEFRAAPLNPFQRAYAYVLEHGIDVVNADMQNYKHLEENIIAVATSHAYFA